MAAPTPTDHAHGGGPDVTTWGRLGAPPEVHEEGGENVEADGGLEAGCVNAASAALRLVEMFDIVIASIK